ncbi:alpha/beta hydrolase family protein [Niabella beijingensis]|uniref:alpha/beta hydrolase family protein n=1 Tax=Niabella beijingensis TaxID=2872700 RepID=UPI001CBE4271|nr:hypothetical protein [Niabella beijingensis]MBZ4191802.1 hypothetical protein [Niabella beijingensis]
MKQLLRLSLLLTIVLGFYSACHNSKVTGHPGFIRDTATWYDAGRNRIIPVAIYRPAAKGTAGLTPVILSHGYGANKGGDYLEYSYLTEALAEKGYYVLSIQHELPTDSLIPMTGIPQVVRRPFWERGAANIRYVIDELKQRTPDLNFATLTLIGHSNGGDMTALFPQQYPGVVAAIITLDNRRMALPRARHPRVYTLRSSDQPADEGVLPTAAEQQQYGIRVIKLPDTIHNDMDNSGNTRQRQEIIAYLLDFLTH